MKERVAEILRHNAIRLLLAFLAVALVTWLLVRNAERPDPKFVMDCGVKDENGEWHLAPCP